MRHGSMPGRTFAMRKTTPSAIIISAPVIELERRRLGVSSIACLSNYHYDREAPNVSLPRPSGSLTPDASSRTPGTNDNRATDKIDTDAHGRILLIILNYTKRSTRWLRARP